MILRGNGQPLEKCKQWSDIRFAFDKDHFGYRVMDVLGGDREHKCRRCYSKDWNGNRGDMERGTKEEGIKETEDNGCLEGMLKHLSMKLLHSFFQTTYLYYLTAYN